MQNFIVEYKDRIRKKINQQTEQQILAVYQRLDAFELRVLTRPALTIYLTTLQADVASLRADVDIILDVRVLESKATPAETTEDTVLATLFTSSNASQHPPHEHSKRHLSRESEKVRAKKK